GNDAIALLRGLRAVRAYLEQPVTEQALQEILEVGRWSGSASNKQPAEVVVVRDKAAKQKLTEYGSNPSASAAVALVIITPAEAERAELNSFDEGRLAERLCLAASAQGLGSCISSLKGEGPEGARQLLGIPAGRRARFVVTVGYTDEQALRARPKVPQPRKPAGEFVHWERF
ncbi:MAG: nitroreductase family protein, partial [Chloroflexota bacterium]|nr:nitroreductase family protein [Chloroflexota bacterium]